MTDKQNDRKCFTIIASLHPEVWNGCALNTQQGGYVRITSLIIIIIITRAEVDIVYEKAFTVAQGKF